ncbi:uncharacterized protein LOC144341741 [Saccoglossus kowalevskii]
MYSRREKLQTDCLADISLCIPVGKWKMIGRKLKISDAQINKIQHDEQDSTERAYQMLRLWQDTTHKPNTDDLVSALEKMELVSVAEQVIDIIGNHQKPSSRSSSEEPKQISQISVEESTLVKSQRAHIIAKKEAMAKAKQKPINKITVAATGLPKVLKPTKTIGKRGSDRGMFDWPRGITIDHLGRLAVADTENNRVQIMHWEGTCDLLLDYKTFERKFEPWDVAVSSEGYYFVTDAGNKQVVVFSDDNELLGTFPDSGIIDPKAIALSQDGKYVFVTDWKGNRHSIKKYTSDGKHLKTYSPSGSQRLKNPHFLAVNSKDEVIVSDQYNHSLQVLDANLGNPHTYICRDLNGKSYLPCGISVDGDDNTYVTSSWSHKIMLYNSHFLFDNAFSNLVKYPSGIAVSKDRPVKIAVTQWYTDIVETLHE